MRRALLLPTLFVLAACRQQAPADPAGEGGAAGELVFAGERACADCDAIATRLVLRQRAGRRDYTLEESFRAGRASARFAERGRWREHHGLLWLDATDGGRRTYALLPDGRLQPRDAGGATLPGRDDTLLPTAASLR